MFGNERTDLLRERTFGPGALWWHPNYKLPFCLKIQQRTKQRIQNLGKITVGISAS